MFVLFSRRIQLSILNTIFGRWTQQVLKVFTFLFFFRNNIQYFHSEETDYLPVEKHCHNNKLSYLEFSIVLIKVYIRYWKTDDRRRTRWPKKELKCS